jgi:hypothetical protein
MKVNSTHFCLLYHYGLLLIYQNRKSGHKRLFLVTDQLQLDIIFSGAVDKPSNLNFKPLHNNSKQWSLTVHYEPPF